MIFKKINKKNLPFNYKLCKQIEVKHNKIEDRIMEVEAYKTKQYKPNEFYKKISSII